MRMLYTGSLLFSLLALLGSNAWSETANRRTPTVRRDHTRHSRAMARSAYMNSMMERRNMNIVNKMHQDFQKGDITSLLQSVAEEVDWQYFGPSLVPFAGTYKTKAEVEDFFKKVSATQELMSMNVQQTLVRGDRAVVLGTFNFKVKSTGKLYQTEFSNVFTINKAGKVTQFRGYMDVEALLEALQ